MELSSATILQREFTRGFRGYEPAEVDEFLEGLAREVDRLQEALRRATAHADDHGAERRRWESRVAEAEARATEAESRAADAETRAAAAASEARMAREELERVKRELEEVRAKDGGSGGERVAELEAQLSRYRDMERELASAIMEARTQASQALKAAEKERDGMLAAAKSEAEAIVAAAKEEAAARLADVNDERKRLQRERDGVLAELEELRANHSALTELMTSFQAKFRSAAAEFTRLSEALPPQDRAEVVHLDSFKKGGR